MAKKIPSNFYQEVNIRKLDRVFSNEGDVPTPSVSDEGKVIKVNNEGKYALLPDGGAQTMTVAITYDETTEEYSADKTHAEIIAAIAAGVIVMATYDGRTYVYAGKNKPSAFDAVYFSYLQADSDDQFIGKIFEIDEDDRIVFSEHDLNNDKVLPAVTSEDYEKILQVDENGNWVAVPDRYHIGDIARSPSGVTKTLLINSNYSVENGISFEIGKLTANDVNWFEWATPGYPLCIVLDSSGNTVISNVAFDDLFEYSTTYTKVHRTDITIQGVKIKSAYRSNFTVPGLYFAVFNFPYFKLLETKPTT